MASESIITLYDVPSSPAGGNIPLSLNVWKTRYALNFKGVPYKTVWLETPEIEPTMRRIGAAPTATKPDGRSHYTVPVIVDHSRLTPSGGPTVVEDSFKIAQYLDDVYPSPSLLLPQGTKAFQALFRDHFNSTVMMPFLPALVPYIWTRLNEASQEYYLEFVESMFGKKIDSICPKGSQKWDDAWVKLEKDFAGLATLLEENGSTADAFIMGEKPTFSDFVVTAFLETLYLVHPDEWVARVSTWDNGKWEKLRKSCAEWRSVH